MEVIIGLAIFFLILFLAFKVLQLIFRLLTAPFRSRSKPRSPNFSGEVVYSGDSSSWNRSGKKLKKDPGKFWVPPGMEVAVGKWKIPGGMVYVGKDLCGASSQYDVEASLIDPKMKVKDGSRCSSNDLDYWPSYSRIPAACRGRFLEWLSTGRKDPDMDIGLVFLFFYGLERRVIVDPKLTTVFEEEKTTIREEVSRLLTIYGDNNSFSKYSTSFLDFSALLMRSEPMYRSKPPFHEKTWELPLSLKVAVAELSRDGLPIPVEWAFSWAWFDPENSLRTPATRCTDELRQLFEIRYRNKYGDGMKIKPNKRTVQVEYRPASPSIGGIQSLQLKDLPDVTSLKGPINKIRAIFDDCVSELDAFSRLLGRNPEARDSLQAKALLPAVLISPEMAGGEAQELCSLFEEGLEGRPFGILPSDAILEHWPPAKDGKYRKADAVGLVQFMEKLGFGLEPDVRFNGPRIDSVDNAVVFKLGKDVPQVPTRDYVAAGLSLRLASAVAVADGIVTEEEQRALEQQLEASSALRPGDKERLRAHMEWLLVERPSLAGLKRKLEDLKPSTRVLLGQTLLVTASADGVIDPEEIKTIRKLYGQLGLDPETVYSDLHSMAAPGTVADEGPVTVRPEERTKGYSIPEKGGAKGAAHPAAKVYLDPKIIEQKRKESQAAAYLLGQIFEEEEPENESTGGGHQAASVAGLDGAHSAMLTRLAEKPQWSMEEVEDIAGNLGLMAEGALETINDAAMEKTEEPLFDIAEDVFLDESILKEFF